MKANWIKSAGAFVGAFALLCAPVVARAAAGPTVSSQVALPLSLRSEQASLVALVLEFAPGAGFPEHTHGAPVTVTVLEGQVTLREEGAAKTYNAGETWTESPGHVHSAVNEGTTTARVLVTALLPNGSELTTLTENGKQHPVPPVNVVYQAAMPLAVPAGDAGLLGVVLNFAPGAGLPDHVHGGNRVVLVLDGEITLTEEGSVKTYKAGEFWTESPGHVHSAANLGGTHTSVALAVLLPAGAELTTVLPTTASGTGTPVGMPRTGLPDAEGPLAQFYSWFAVLIPAAAILVGGALRYHAGRKLRS